MKPINSTDATQGQGLRARVETRKHELEAAMSKLPLGPERVDIERAIGAIEGLLTGDLDNIPAVVGAQLSQWLEANKHLAEHPAAPVLKPIQVIVSGPSPIAAPEGPDKIN
jgi:hypothetical protein